ncbi:hypothetical protein F9K85_09650 [Brucella tritici]|uniref:hypothetical protein n=1 Tax=Brucella tritici TaxID=94626 RepID=UPI00124E1BE8|nr:hypothetical protein [Brucella tritici]KAB2676750.1 hypothetical protein F9K85_09650 [Brucella tritici]
MKAAENALMENRWLVPGPAIELILTAALPHLPQGVGVKKLDDAALSASVNSYAANYEFRGDNGDYTPTDVERVMIEDAIEGFLSNFLSALEPSAARELALEEAARIAFDISENGEYHGEASVDSASSIYQQGAFEVYEAIRALSSPDHANAGKVEGDGLHSADISNLIEAAKEEAAKAMRKFPQPNYVISKIAEEAGEVVKAAIHCAEGRENPEAVIAEIKQTFAMLFRLLLEGDEVHGLSPLLPSAPSQEVA